METYYWTCLVEEKTWIHKSPIPVPTGTGQPLSPQTIDGDLSKTSIGSRINHQDFGRTLDNVGNWDRIHEHGKDKKMAVNIR